TYIYKKQELPRFDMQIDQIKLRIDNLLLPDEFKEYILEFLDDQKNLYLTKLSVGSTDFSKNAHRLFDWGSDRLDLLLTNTPNVEFKLHIKHALQGAEYIKKRFEQTLKKYGIDSFEVKIDSFSPHIINVGYHSISIGSEIRRFECNIDRLVVHEIESHVLQTENTKNSPTPLSEFTKYGNQHLYGEGLAIYNEITTRKITPSAFEMYYCRIKAVRLLHKSFREIYQTLLENLNPQRAFVMTYRVKRGMADTSQPGGFPKDASYLLGFHEIENLINENYPQELLYATKSPVLSAILDKYNLINTQKTIIPKFLG
ncbi:MAG: DUF1704 domain-containing protein, partial [Candidatus Levybacteria bacterium]|nr:DUF1704 domain-containing protein [Candidatus Levybacteria bacterium]